MDKRISFLLLSVLFLGTVSVFAGNVFVSESGIQAAYISENGSEGLTETFVCADGNGGNRTLIFENGLLVDADGGIGGNESNESVDTISSHATLGNDLVSYYSLDETSGDASDSVGSNTGTLSGTITQNVAGKIDTAYDFGAGEIEPSTLQASLSGATEVSTSIWIKADSLSGYKSIMADNTGTGSMNWDIRTNGVDLQISTHILNGVTWSDVGVTLSTGTWYHIVMIANQTNTRVYVDNVLNNTFSATSGSYTTGNYGFVVGNRIKDGHDYYEYWDGKMDEMGVWDRVLTSNEIEDLYNEGDGLAYE